MRDWADRDRWTRAIVAGMSTYSQGHAESVLRSHRWRTAENSAAYLLPSLRSGMTVLDVGCGPGTITADLARLVGPDGHVVGVDPSADVVEQARAEAAAAGVANARFEVGDVYDLPAAVGRTRFDVVHAHQVLQHVPDPVGALVAMRAAAMPGGLVAARDSDYGAFTWFPDVSELDEWLALYRAVARHAGGEPDAGRRMPAWARAAGFTDVTASASVWCFASTEDRAWWGGMWADRILHSRIAELAVATGAGDREALERLSAGWRRWAADEDGTFLIVHGEILCRA